MGVKDNINEGLPVVSTAAMRAPQLSGGRLVLYSAPPGKVLLTDGPPSLGRASQHANTSTAHCFNQPALSVWQPQL